MRFEAVPGSPLPNELRALRYVVTPAAYRLARHHSGDCGRAGEHAAAADRAPCRHYADGDLRLGGKARAVEPPLSPAEGDLRPVGKFGLPMGTIPSELLLCGKARLGESTCRRPAPLTNTGNAQIIA